jgi:hypothetical protein
MAADVLPNADLGSITPTGSGTVADPYLYSFLTKCGLAMGTYKIYGNNLTNKNVLLNLKKGPVTGTQSATAFDLKAAATGQHAADLTIYRVGAIQIGKVWTYAGFYSAGAARAAGTITIGAVDLLAGNIEIAEILAYGGGQTTRVNAGNVIIHAAGDVLIWDGANPGTLSTIGYGGINCRGFAGNITIKHDGSFLSTYVNAYANYGSTILGSGGGGGDVDFDGGSASGTFVTSMINTSCPGSYDGGRAGDVTVKNYASVTIASGILARQTSESSSGLRGGNVAVTGIAGDITIGLDGIQSYASG